jgi:hypothetical protein
LELLENREVPSTFTSVSATGGTYPTYQNGGFVNYSNGTVYLKGGSAYYAPDLQNGVAGPIVQIAPSAVEISGAKDLGGDVAAFFLDSNGYLHEWHFDQQRYNQFVNNHNSGSTYWYTTFLVEQNPVVPSGDVSSAHLSALSAVSQSGDMDDTVFVLDATPGVGTVNYYHTTITYAPDGTLQWATNPGSVVSSGATAISAAYDGPGDDITGVASVFVISGSNKALQFYTGNGSGTFTVWNNLTIDTNVNYVSGSQCLAPEIAESDIIGYMDMGTAVYSKTDNSVYVFTKWATNTGTRYLVDAAGSRTVVGVGAGFGAYRQEPERGVYNVWSVVIPYVMYSTGATTAEIDHNPISGINTWGMQAKFDSNATYDSTTAYNQAGWTFSPSQAEAHTVYLENIDNFLYEYQTADPNPLPQHLD